jgi:hypothetical protein
VRIGCSKKWWCQEEPGDRPRQHEECRLIDLSWGDSPCAGYAVDLLERRAMAGPNKFQKKVRFNIKKNNNNKK